MTHTVENIVDLQENDPLVKRLSALDIPMPDTLVSRVLAAQPPAQPPRRRRLRTLTVTAIAVIGLIGANLGASYVSPKYAQALADAPGAGTLTGPILQQAGLATVGAEPLDVRATAGGYTVHLFGAYADAVRTTVFIQILGPNGHEVPDGTVPTFGATLTDQFGHTYHMANEFGMPVIHFEPLTGPAATLGARLTLHIDSLTLLTPPPAGDNTAATTTQSGIPVVKASSAKSTVVSGPWDLGFTTTSSGGQDLALPPVLELGDTTYTFTSVRTTASLLEIRWTISGGAITRQQQLAEEMGAYVGHGGQIPADLEARQKANYDETATNELLDPNGKAIDPIYGFGRGIKRDGKVVGMDMDAWYPVTAHQTYRFEVTGAASGEESRSITVP